VIDEDNDAFAASFQWLGGNPEDPDSSITKETIQKVLQDFELDSNVDAVLGTDAMKSSLNLKDLQQALTNRK